MRAYMCNWCGRIYTPNRPFLCECKSNAFLEEYETSPEELKELKEEGATIIDFVGKNKVELLKTE